MSHDDHTPTAGALLASFADCIDHADWDGLAALLAEDFHCRYVATGEAFDRDGFVAVNRDYPGRWRFERQDLVDAGQRAVLRAKVSDATGESDEVHFVATFATARSGVLAEVVEVWAEVAEAPHDRRPL
ncbi:ester cyclase [Knoellia locipacati]|uniref:nuclear transport factor 2 family protein n=1 Tax=Knoellia locipacati TaxID=882824 RepID=UPI00384F54EB